MADLDKILEEYKTQIERAAPKGPATQMGRIPRSGPKRPWNKDAPVSQEVSIAAWDLDSEGPAEAKGKHRPWFATWERCLIVARKRKKFMAGSFAASLAVFGLLASQLKPTYYATILVYIPAAKTDDISAKLDDVIQNLKLVAGPTIRKMPTFFFAQRIKSAPMRAAVLAAYSAKHDTPLQLSKLSVDADYHAPIEALALSVYYPQPEIAAEIANIYEERFSGELKAERDAYYLELSAWITRARMNVTSDIAGLEKDLEQVKRRPKGFVNYGGLSERFNQSMGEKEVQLLRLKEERAKLDQALGAKTLEALLDLPFAEFSNLAEMKKQISALQTQDQTLLGQTTGEIARLREQAEGIANDLLKRKNAEIDSLVSEVDSLKTKIHGFQAHDSESSAIANDTNDLEKALMARRAQLVALDDLDRQILEKGTHDPSPDVILEKAHPDPGSAFPKPILLVTGTVMLSLMATLALLVVRQRLQPVVTGAAEIAQTFTWPNAHFVVERDERIQTGWKRGLGSQRKIANRYITLVLGSQNELAIYFAHAAKATGERCLIAGQSGLERTSPWAASLKGPEATRPEGVPYVECPAGFDGQSEAFLASLKGTFDRVLFVVDDWGSFDFESLAPHLNGLALTVREGDESAALSRVKFIDRLAPALKWVFVAKQGSDSLVNSLARNPAPLNRRPAAEFLSRRPTPKASPASDAAAEATEA